jgi:protein tyrosine phosphatase (PTP) superfamily phosphohydrolase (DUF442 family)
MVVGKRGRAVRRGLLGLAMLLGATGCASSVRTVEPNKCFRSGQLSAAALEKQIQDHKIKTVVNLRGFEPDKKWYIEEREVCRRLGVRHIDVTLDSQRPDREEIIRLLDAYQTADQPILLHSYSSNGRVGFASSLYRMTVLEQPKDQARQEMAFWQNRSVPFVPLGKLDEFLYEWRSKDEFLASYQLPQRSRNSTVARPIADEPPVRLGAPIVADRSQ